MARHYTHAEIVELVATAKSLKEQAEQADRTAREAVLSRFGERMGTMGDSTFEPIEVNSELGRAKISHLAGRETLDKSKVATFLTPGQFSQCLKVGEPSFQIRFAPAIRTKAA